MKVPEQAYRFGSFVLEPTRRRLLRSGALVVLRAKSFDVLSVLAASAGRIVTKGEFVDAVWSGRSASDESLARCICDVRRALDDKSKEIIRTVPSRGYLFACRLEGNSYDGGTTAFTAITLPRPSREGRREAAPDTPKIAVRAFRSLGLDPADILLAASLTADIQSALSHIGQFRVICDQPLGSPEAVTPHDVLALYQLEGSVRRMDDRMRFTVNLLEAENRVLLWSHHVDVGIECLTSAHDTVVEGLAGHVETELLASEYSRIRLLPEAGLNARQNCVLAMHHASRQSDPDTLAALDCLDSALATDPENARALGMKAWILVFRAFQGWADMAPSLAAAQTLVAQAWSAENRELWAFLATGLIGFATRDTDTALDALREAVSLSPSSVHAHGLLGIAHAFAGDGERGLELIAQAMQLSPREPFLVDFDLYRAFAYVQARRDEEGLRAAVRANQRRPNHVFPLILGASCAGHAGRTTVGTAMLTSLRTLAPALSREWIQMTSPYVLASDRDRLVAGLVASGLS